MNVRSGNRPPATAATGRTGPGARAGRAERPERPERAERPERPERPGRAERPERAGHPGRPARGGGTGQPESTTGRGRGRPLVDDKRRRILDAALRTFAARGYHGTAVPEVAEAAGVGTGTLYRYFEHKEALVNEVYRDAKLRLAAALFAVAPDSAATAYHVDVGERWFTELWQRLGVFAEAEPDAFRFLEMQDHVAYLDAESRKVELSVLAPLQLAGKRLATGSRATHVDVLIALLWGAFVGLVKASRLGYLRLDPANLAQAGRACWRMIAPDPLRAASPRRSRTTKG